MTAGGASAPVAGEGDGVLSLFAEPDPTAALPVRTFRHLPALDGLRGVAVALVVAFHFYGHRVVTGGGAGVDVFFVLSGFLITVLLLQERDRTGRVDVLAFYGRRARRLLPALVAFLGVWLVLFALFRHSSWFSATPSGDGTGHPLAVTESLQDVLWSLLYSANWDVIDGGMAAPLPHLWSLSVEEQFYLAWPLVLTLLLTFSARFRLRLVLLAAVTSAILPLLLWDGGRGADRIYFGTDTRMVGLLAGSVAAMCWRRRTSGDPRSGPRRAALGAVVVLGMALFQQDVPARYLVGFAALALASCQVVLHLAEGPSPLGSVLSLAPLRWLGRRSYALYLWHYAWATWTHPWGPWVGGAIGITGAMVCSELSWRWVERPVLAREAHRTPAERVLVGAHAG